MPDWVKNWNSWDWDRDVASRGDRHSNSVIPEMPNLTGLKSTKRPDSLGLKRIKDTFEDMSFIGENMGFLIATTSLEHWYLGNGQSMKRPLDWFRHYPTGSVLKAEKKIREKFESKLKWALARTKKGADYFGVPWFDEKVLFELNGQGLWFIDQKTKLKSRGAFRLFRKDNNVFCKGKIFHCWYEIYDHNKLKKHDFDSVNRLKSNDAKILEDWGGAVPYIISTHEWHQKVRCKGVIISSWSTSKNTYDFEWKTFKDWTGSEQELKNNLKRVNY